MRRFLLCRRAGAAMEFAICGLAFFLLVFAVLDLGDLALVTGAMTYSTEVTAHAAAVQTEENLAGLGASTSCLTSSQIVAIFNAALPAILPTAVYQGNGAGAPGLAYSWSQQENDTGTYLTVTASYKWVPPGGFLHASVPLTVTETQMLEGSSGTVGAECS